MNKGGLEENQNAHTQQAFSYDLMGGRKIITVTVAGENALLPMIFKDQIIRDYFSILLDG